MTVKDLESLQALLRENRFNEDPLSQSNPSNQICARGDLNPDEAARKSSGCIDTKAATLTMAQQL